MAYNENEVYNDTQSKWNIDDEILKLVKFIKMSFLTNIKSWDLEQAYFDLLLYYSEVNAKFKAKERKELDEDFINLEKNRTNFIKLNNIDKKENSGVLYNNILKLYSKLNTFCKENGLWFREGDGDNRGL